MNMLTASEMREYQKRQKEKERIVAQRKADKIFNRAVHKINKRICNCKSLETAIRIRTESLYSYKVMLYLIPKLRNYYEGLGYNCTNLYDCHLLDGIEISWNERSF